MAKKNYLAPDPDPDNSTLTDEEIRNDKDVDNDTDRNPDGTVKTDLSQSKDAKGRTAALPTVDQPRDAIDEENDPHRRVEPVDLKTGRRKVEIVDNPDGGFKGPDGKIVAVPLDHFTKDEAKALDDREERIYKYNVERKFAGLPMALTKAAQDLIP